jgi:predicted enzyme related to lactoylglutathione lyase
MLERERNRGHMAVRSEYSAGTFCWVDLATTDPEAAKSFYGDVLGWSYQDLPTDGGDTYSLAMLEASQVAAIYSMPPSQQGAPPHWVSYVSVDSADDAAKRAEDLGGNVLMEPTDIMTAGRMAVIQDPTDAVVAVWEAKEHFGAALVNQHGTLCWNELMTKDPDAATSFYCGLFGWKSEPFGDNYTVFMNGERPGGGMILLEEEMGPVPPNWSVYFCVDDCDAIQQHAVSLGGAVRMPPMDFPEVGRACVLGDPQGGTFAVIKLLNPPD